MKLIAYKLREGVRTVCVYTHKPRKLIARFKLHFKHDEAERDTPIVLLNKSDPGLWSGATPSPGQHPQAVPSSSSKVAERSGTR